MVCGVVSVPVQPNIKEDFYGTDQQGNKVEFFTHIHRDANKPKSLKLQHKRKHPQLSKAEMRGDRWFPDIHKRQGGPSAPAQQPPRRGSGKRGGSGGRRRK